MQTSSNFESTATNGKKNDAQTNSHAKANSAHEESGHGIAHEFQKFVTDIEELLKATTNLNGEDLQRAKAKLNERITAAKEVASEMGETVMNRARQTAATTNTYVHEKPWTAISAGAAAGVLVGFLLSRRH